MTDAHAYIMDRVDDAINALNVTLDSPGKRVAVRDYMEQLVVEPVAGRINTAEQEALALRTAIADAVEQANAPVAVAVRDPAYASLRSEVRDLMFACEDEASTTTSANSERTLKQMVRKLSAILRAHP